MRESCLGILQILLGINNVSIEFWFEVIKNFLRWVSVLVLIDTDPVVADDLLSDAQVLEISLDISIHAEIWYTIVHWVGNFFGFWVLVLSTAGTGANWVRCDLKSLG